jgi:Ca-activated chloride channel homolog
MYLKTVSIYVLLLVLNEASAQDAGIYSYKADRLYKDSNYLEAEEAYRKANDIKPEFKNLYNIGNSLYQQGRAKEAAEYYQKSLRHESESKGKSNAYYNLGNSYFNQKEYEKSIKAYQDALKINPKDKAAKQNLVLAKRQKQLQEQQQQQQQQQQQEQQQQDNQQQQSPPQEQPTHQEQEDKKDQNKPAENNSMTREQAEQLMRMVDDRDKKIREKIQRTQSKSPKREKDW